MIPFGEELSVNGDNAQGLLKVVGRYVGELRQLVVGAEEIFRPLEDAFRIAQLDLVQWLGTDYGLDPLDAYQLITQAVESPLANVCDPNYTSVAKMRKQYLPPAAAMGGAHAQLSELAAAYRGD